MNNFFLLNEAINIDDLNGFREGMSELIALPKTFEDTFIKHDSVWILPVINNLYEHFGQAEQAIVKFIEQIDTIGTSIQSESVFDSLYPNDLNAFLGIDFSEIPITLPKQITNTYTFNNFKDVSLWDFSFRDLWVKREKLFPTLILCGDVEAQVSKIGNSSYLNQIVERLRTLNGAVEIWKRENGDFSYKAVNRDFPLRISPESKQTMAKFANERLFTLPDKRRESFELHIKTGDLRFHFYPDNTNRVVYVGYIGPHLSTATN
jgi:hypothetical protein